MSWLQSFQYRLRLSLPLAVSVCSHLSPISDVVWARGSGEGWVEVVWGLGLHSGEGRECIVCVNDRVNGGGLGPHVKWVGL